MSKLWGNIRVILGQYKGYMGLHWGNIRFMRVKLMG